LPLCGLVDYLYHANSKHVIRGARSAAIALKAGIS
jgi:hypothetical protein